MPGLEHGKRPRKGAPRVAKSDATEKAWQAQVLDAARSLGWTAWHFHDSQAHLFADLPPYQGKWDGHDTPEKYRRLVALYTAPAAQLAQEGGGVEGKSHG